MMSIRFFILFILCSQYLVAQNYLLPNEELIYSFETAKGKKVILAKDKTDKYIIYRFGTKDKIEFEYPEKTKDSWSKITYSFYLRGGGAGNEAIDLNYTYFTNSGFQYVIYDTYSASANKSKIGIQVIDIATKNTSTIIGLYKTRKGSLIDFRDNGLLKIGDDLFD